MKKKQYISDEMLAAFLDGNTSSEESMQVLQAMVTDPELAEVMDIFDKVHEEETEEEETHDAKGTFLRIAVNTLPISALAALGESNLCDIECEKDILRRKGIRLSKESLVLEAERNQWKKEEGMPLYNIGRLLEQNGLVVFRRFNFTMNDVRMALENEASLIAVVSVEALQKDYQGEMLPNHAVVITDYNAETGFVTIFDPQSGRPGDFYSVEDFTRAWAPSKNYVVMAAKKAFAEYIASPIDVSSETLPESLNELREMIAENAHEVWAINRQREGWTYGPVRNDELKQNPDLVPYSQLPESEKLYDRELAMNTLKLVMKFGYDIVKR